MAAMLGLDLLACGMRSLGVLSLLIWMHSPAYNGKLLTLWRMVSGIDAACMNNCKENETSRIYYSTRIAK